MTAQYEYDDDNVICPNNEVLGCAKHCADELNRILSELSAEKEAHSDTRIELQRAQEAYNARAEEYTKLLEKYETLREVAGNPNLEALVADKKKWYAAAVKERVKAISLEAELKTLKEQNDNRRTTK